MTIDEIKTEIRKIEKYYDFNHQTNDYDVLVNLTEIVNLILLQNKISYNKAIDDFVKALCIEYAPVSDKMQKEYDNVCLRFERIAEQLKEGRKNENYNKEES
ncbi:MAG: hypothetical protein MSA15_03155 [Clostridium sp.]|nr:hypothetical protein [Clostridium sp.]